MIRPGDTLYLRQGTYRGKFSCTLNGKAERPITIRQYPGERATIDCQDAKEAPTFTITGEWLVFWGFEMTCSDPKRITAEAGSWPSDIRRGGISCRSSHVKFINLVIHDLGGGIGFWSEGEAGEVYGCVIFANGWQGPDRLHGHAIYAQNQHGTKRIADNIIFNQFGHGIHCYGSSKAYLSGFEIDGNILFNNGDVGTQAPTSPNILVGGESPVSRTTVTRNIALHQHSSVRFGYPFGPDNLDITITDNYFVGPVAVDRFERAHFKQNSLFGSNLVEYKPAKNQFPLPEDWNDNQYWQTQDNQAPFMIWKGDQSTRYDFREWRHTTATDSRSQFVNDKPKEARVFLRKNRYDAGRGNLAIFNWPLLEFVDVDLSSLLNVGQKYRIVNVQDYFGAPAKEGVFDGKPVAIPMLPGKKAQPIGWSEPLPATEPFFGAYVIQPQG
jgi:hypothetical protein